MKPTRAVIRKWGDRWMVRTPMRDKMFESMSEALEYCNDNNLEVMSIRMYHSQ